MLKVKLSGLSNLYCEKGMEMFEQPQHAAQSAVEQVGASEQRHVGEQEWRSFACEIRRSLWMEMKRRVERRLDIARPRGKLHSVRHICPRHASPVLLLLSPKHCRGWPLLWRADGPLCEGWPLTLGGPRCRLCSEQTHQLDNTSVPLIG